MFEFMKNAFYVLCGVSCISVAVVIGFSVVYGIINAVKRGNKHDKY